MFSRSCVCLKVKRLSRFVGFWISEGRLLDRILLRLLTFVYATVQLPAVRNYLRRFGEAVRGRLGVRFVDTLIFVTLR